MAKITIQKNNKNAVSSKNNTALTTNKVSLRKDNSGVSAVIGVILMVAITVIAAAIIGTFVLGIMGNQPAAPGFAAFSAERLGNGSVTVKNIAPQGQPVVVTKILNADTGEVINYGADQSYMSLSDLMKPFTLKYGLTTRAGFEDLPVTGFNLAIVGKTGGSTAENVLQTIYISEAVNPTIEA